MHETRFDFAHDFEPCAEMIYQRDIHLIRKPVKSMKMTMIDITLALITKVPKHLIEKKIQNHVHQKNHVVK